jgi:hypothetical protein
MSTKFSEKIYIKVRKQKSLKENFAGKNERKNWRKVF